MLKRRIILVKRKPGSQHTFSQIDGEAGSLSGSENCSSTTEQQKEREEEKGEEEKKEEELEAKKEEEEKKMWDEWLKKKWEEQEEKMKEEKEEEEEEEKSEINDPTSTLGPSWNPTDPYTSEVTTEPIDSNRCLRPLQRARERREARLKKESDAHAEIDPDPHVPGSQRSRVSSDREQDRVQLRCDRCNNKLTDSDWSKIKSKGWDAEIVEHAPFCSSCIDQWRVL